MTLFRAIRCDTCGHVETGYTGDRWLAWTPRGSTVPRHTCPTCEELEKPPELPLEVSDV